MNEITVIEVLKVLVPIVLASGALFLKIGRAQQDIAELKETVEKLLRQDVHNAEMVGVRDQTAALKERVARLEVKVFNGI